MMAPSIFPHLDEDFCWRVYARDADGNLVPLTRPFFHLAEVEQAAKVMAMQMAT